MPILPDHPFQGRQYPGDVILLAVRWYLRYPLAYEHVAELLVERGLAGDRSCVAALSCRPMLPRSTSAVVRL